MNYFWWLISFHAIRLIFRYVVFNNAFITMTWFLEWFCFCVCVCVGFFGSSTVHVHIPSFVIVSQWYGKAGRSLQWRRAFGNPCSAFQCPRRKVTYRVGFYSHCNLLCFYLACVNFLYCVPLPSVEYCLFLERQSLWLGKEELQIYWFCAWNGLYSSKALLGRSWNWVL